MIFFIRNCRVRVSFYFFALLCVAAFLDRRGIMMWGLLAALLHEGGHIAAMLLIPEKTPDRISITPFGIRIENTPLCEFGNGNAFILAAGSGANFLCASVTFGFLPEFAAVSLVMGIFNLLPVESMDGGGMLLILFAKFMNGNSAVRMLKIVSYMTLCAMAVSGIYVLIVTGYNFTLLGATASLALSEIKRKTGKNNNRRGSIR